jgi:hypothetical protein
MRTMRKQLAPYNGAGIAIQQGSEMEQFKIELSKDEQT